MLIRGRLSTRRRHLDYTGTLPAAPVRMPEPPAGSDALAPGELGSAEFPGNESPGSLLLPLGARPDGAGAGLEVVRERERTERARGLLASRQAAEAELGFAAQALRRAVVDLTERTDSFYANADRSLASLAFEIVRKVIEVEVKTNPDIVKYAVRKALTAMQSDDLTLRLNPADAQVIRAELPGLVNSSRLGTFVKLVEDLQIERGGCVVECALGTLDLQPSAKIGQLERNYLHE